MTDQQIWEVIQIGFNDIINDEVTYPLPPPYDENNKNSEDSLLSQNAYEFGMMNAQEGFELNEEELGEYVEEVRYNAGF